jgi:hypothetical protein
LVEKFCNDLDFKTIVPCLIIHPIVHPLRVRRHNVTKADVYNLQRWDSVRGSVWDSVRGSVWGSVRDSVWDSVWAYASSFFDLEKWKYIDHEPGVNLYQPLIDLWDRGFVPSFDGKTWRLHQGKGAKIVYEWVREA